MSLSTIKDSDAPSKTKKLAQRPVSSLRTDDIQGAKPLIRGYQHINKPEFSNYTLDIEKAFPRSLHPALNKPNRNLSTSDIEKSQPQSSSFKTKRETNPLNPEYRLASFENRPVTPPKFVRDSIRTDDIEKARPEVYLKWAVRDNIGVKDIEGARPKAEKMRQKPDFMDVRDINEGRFVSSRVTNPLEPCYTVRDEDGVVVIGPIEGAKTRPCINLAPPPHTRHLDNGDIDGSKTNTVGHPVLGNNLRNYSKDPLDTSDIPGSSANSHRTGIKTLRVTNPLQPTYTWTTEDPVDSVPLVKKNNKKETEKKKKETEEETGEKKENTLRFWGVTPSGSRGDSEPQTKPPSRPQSSKPRPASFRNNVEKFFSVKGEESNEGIERNVERFFDNSNPKLEDRFLNVQNPNTIYRCKRQVAVVEPLGFKENLNRFCGTCDSRPWSSGSYRFKLARGEIGKPE